MTRAIVLSLLCACACGQECRGWGVPTEEWCARTAQATVVIDDVYEQHGFERVAVWLDVDWIHGESFAMNGVLKYGYAWPSLEHGPHCRLMVADRLQHLISETSLAHEQMHCAMTLSGRELDGDMDHNDNEAWTAVVWAARQALRTQGM